VGRLAPERPAERADDALAAPVAVDVGGVDEGDAGLDRGAEGRKRLVLVDLTPVGAELPGAKADHTDGGGGAPKGPLLHGWQAYSSALPLARRDERWHDLVA